MQLKSQLSGNIDYKIAAADFIRNEARVASEVTAPENEPHTDAKHGPINMRRWTEGVVNISGSCRNFAIIYNIFCVNYRHSLNSLS